MQDGRVRDQTGLSGGWSEMSLYYGKEYVVNGGQCLWVYCAMVNSGPGMKSIDREVVVWST